jgi:hypothetical protein
MKKQFSKEERAEYFAGLRSRWQEAKEMSQDEKQINEAIMLSHGLNMSLTGFCYVQAQMQAQGMEGLPYIDAKTFQGWHEAGFTVRKGEHSTLNGLTWVAAKTKNEATGKEESKFAFPKQYFLFHRSQVQPL